MLKYKSYLDKEVSIRDGQNKVNEMKQAVKDLNKVKNSCDILINELNEHIRYGNRLIQDEPEELWKIVDSVVIKSILAKVKKLKIGI